MRPVLILAFCSLAAYAELRPVPVAQVSTDGLMDPASAVWNSVTPISISLQRTPLLFPTDQPASRNPLSRAAYGARRWQGTRPPRMARSISRYHIDRQGR